LAAAHRKWPTGCYLLWYPIKDAAEITSFVRKLSRLGIGKMLRIELFPEIPTDDKGLRGSGLIAVNPPWRLHEELEMLLPALGGILSRAAACRTTLSWLVRE
jgi:23S rRNA (adenine2030-N6)-methyltransferase